MQYQLVHTTMYASMVYYYYVHVGVSVCAKASVLYYIHIMS